MSGKYNFKCHVLESKSEYCTADYGTREPSYSTHHGMDFINDAGHACNAIAVADGEVVAMQDFVDGFSAVPSRQSHSLSSNLQCGYNTFSCTVLQRKHD